ncbi:MAG: pilus assembly protein N-terminal domain-containing protein [Vicinamibacterales bacterium]
MDSVGRWARRAVALAIYIIVILVAAPQAQQPVAFAGAPGAISAGPAASTPDATSIDLLVGRSTILNVGSAITRVSLTVPDIADAMVTTPEQLLIHGKAPGTISLFVWDRAGGIKTYEVNVRRDLKQLAEQMQQLFPGEPITVAGSGKDIVISGTVSSKYVIDKAADVASGYVDKKEDIVNLLKQQQGVATDQVMLRVRFAEVSRTALQQLGASLFTGPTGYNNLIARSTTQQFAAPDYTNLSRTSDLNNKLTAADGQYSLSDFLNLFIFSNKYNIGTVIKALQSKGLFQSLAEPNLIASNGKEASFLAGGEFPYPVVQPSSGGNSVTIQFKEFGVRLTFTPTVLSGDLINLKVKPEVSSLDFTNGITLSGFQVPALTTRRTETELELEDGQTFAIAGLLNNTVNSTMSKVPGIGDIPVLGYLFKSRAYQKDQTELVVMITPSIVRRGSTGVSQGLPSIVEPYLGAPPKSMPQPPPYVGSPVNAPGAPRATGGGGDTPSAAPMPAAARTPSASVAPASRAPVNPHMAAAPAIAPRSMPVESETRAPVAAATPMSMPVVPVASAPVPVGAAVAVPRAPATVQTVPTAPKPDAKAVKQAEAGRAAAAKKAAEEQKAAQKKAAEDQKVAQQKAADDQKAADAAARTAAADQKAADEKAAQDQARQAKLDADRAKRQAEVEKKNADAARKQQDEQNKKDKAVADAAERLREAQAAYDKAKTGGG